MEFEEDYLEYIAIFTLSMLTVSASYFINPANPLTYAIIILVPFTFGYIAYVSRNGFKKSSLSSMIMLFFIPMDIITSLTAITIGLGAPLISAFSGGSRFKDYFRTASIPLLILGLIIGSAAYYEASNSPDTKNQIKDIAANTAGMQAEVIVEQTDILDNYGSRQTEMIETTSQAAIRASKAYIINETRGSFTPSQQRELQTAFNKAENEVPSQLSQRTQEKMNNSTLNISDKVSEMTRENFKGRFFLALIPLTAMIFYSSNPLVGFLMALAATFFGLLDRKIRESGAS